MARTQNLEVGHKYQIEYKDANGKATSREIAPLYPYTLYSAVTGETFEYVSALCFSTEDFRNFNLDRVQSIEDLGEVQLYPLYFPNRNASAGQKPVPVAATDFEDDAAAKAKGFTREPRRLRRAIRKSL